MIEEYPIKIIAVGKDDEGNDARHALLACKSVNVGVGDLGEHEVTLSATMDVEEGLWKTSDIANYQGDVWVINPIVWIQTFDVYDIEIKSNN